MNFSIIKRTLGFILLFEALFLLVPTLTAIIYGEKEVFSFLYTIGICAALGGLCTLKKPKNTAFYAKEGFVIVALSWIVMSLFGSLPFVFSRAIPNFIDAFFETTSGFTTTGATIVATGAEVEAMAKSVLMWRSFTHWIGGMGVLVLLIAFLPMSGAKNMHMMKAESPGPTVGKLVPRIRTTAVILYVIYTAITVLEFILLLCGGMPVFDAINTAFATAGTGGFSIKADGFAGYSPYIQIIVTVFMLLFAINFNSYFALTRKKFKEFLSAEVKVFLIIVLLAISAITANLCVQMKDSGLSFGQALRHSAFSVASIISTTGFVTVDFNLWPAFSKAILVLLMFVGACAGSTGGGMKVSRMMVMSKGAAHEIRRVLHPNQVKKITMDKRVVEHETVRSINAYFFAFVLIFVASLILISLDGGSTTTNFTAVAATMNNVGPGLDAVGPAGSFAGFSWGSKLVFIFDMLVGRLEVFPMLILFAPSTWRK